MIRNMAPVLRNAFLDIQCRFTLKLVHEMIITYNQMHRTDKYSQHNSIIWPDELMIELSGCGFEFRCCHFNFIVFIRNII